MRARSTQARPFELRRLIAGIVDPGDSSRLQRCAQPGSWNIEQGPGDFLLVQRRITQTEIAEMQTRGHSGQPVETAAARQPHQQCLGPIVLRMSCEEQRDAVGPHGVAHQAVARVPCRGLYAGLRLGSFPDESGMGKPQPFGLGGHGPRLGGRLWAQAMVDGQHHVQGRISAPCWHSQSAYSTIRAVLSLPPETASAQRIDGLSPQRPNKAASSSGRIGSWSFGMMTGTATQAWLNQAPQPLRWRSA